MSNLPPDSQLRSGQRPQASTRDQATQQLRFFDSVVIQAVPADCS